MKNIGFVTITFFSYCINFVQADFGLSKVDQDLKGTGDVATESTINNIMSYFLGFLALIAVIWIMYGGVQILTASGDEERAKKGRKTVFFALLGMFVIWIAWALVSGVFIGLEQNT